MRRLIGWSFGCLLLGIGLLAGCGSGGDDCADTTCEFGTCNPDDGTCQNRSSCNTVEDCLPGYECADDGTCEAIDECSEDGDCSPGVCREGVCQNPDTCSDDEDCLPTTYCDTSGDSGSCEPDPCNDVRCPRGVCERGTGDCVSKESCEQETETFDCVAGEQCADGTCVDNDQFCEELSCDRGTCSVDEGACVNPGSCDEDGDCLSGYFCDGMGRCQTDLCEQQQIDCGDDGRCRPRTGRCENPTRCNSADDCRPDHVCIEGTCRLESSACGDAPGDGGCPGNQECNYDASEKTASCEEPDDCETSLDCKDDRQCGGRTCLKPETCEADRFEENDTPGEATPFVDVATGRTLGGSVCAGDPDVFEIDTNQMSPSSTGGTLVVDLAVRDRERGLGKLDMELTDGDGSTFGTVDTGALGVEGEARLTKELTGSDLGTQTLEVRPGDDVKQTGVDYRLSVDMLPSSAVEACRTAPSIEVNQRVGGDTTNGMSKLLGSTCTAATNPKAEEIYRLDVDRPQELTFDLEPRDSDANLSMSLRNRCLQRGSELACADGKGDGGTETMTTIVSPGTYYLVVQAPNGSDVKGGSFRLDVSRVYTTCSDEDGYCDGDGNSYACTADGGRYRKLECDNGCNPSRGLCVPPDGDKCGTAKTISPNKTQTRTLNLAQSYDDYRVGAGSCFGSNPGRTKGRDLTYKVEIPANQGVEFEATFRNGAPGSMYLVGDCGRVDGTCDRGVESSTTGGNNGNTSKASLVYGNPTNQAETYWLVVDTKAGAQVSTAELTVGYFSVQCVPNKISCGSGGGMEFCDRRGQSETTLGQCANSCSSGRCQSKLELSGNKFDTCGDTINLRALAAQSGGVTLEGTWGDYADDFSSEPCGGGSGGRITSYDVSSNDAIYQLDLKAGDTVDATISTTNYEDPAIWLWDTGDCGTGSAQCLAGESSERSSASLNYSTSKSRTVYLTVDSERGSGSESFDLDVEVK